MYGPAKYAVLVLGAAVLAYLLAPLAVLFLEVSNNPNLIGLEVIPIEVTGNQSVLIKIVYKHGITVGFDNLTITIGNQVINFGNVKEGVYEKNVTLPISALQGLSEARISFVLAGIYPVNIEVKGS